MSYNNEDFVFEIDEKDAEVAILVGKIQDELRRAYVSSGKKKNDLAQKLEVDRSVITRRLKPSANLTVRSLAELIWAIGNLDTKFELVPVVLKGNQFEHDEQLQSESARNNSRMVGNRLKELLEFQNIIKNNSFKNLENVNTCQS